MSYTVGEVARLTGVTVRALHHYDEIGLLPPGDRSPAGYRRYTEPDLERLPQILTYRELGFPLEEISTIPADPATDVQERFEVFGDSDPDQWFYECSYEMHRGLAEMYLADHRFTENIDRYASGLAGYLRDAIVANAARVGG
jgi:DNA-binding transcriptional MerR regulator